MSNYIIDGNTLTDIADAIRTKEGSSEPILTEDMATRIENLSGASPSPFMPEYLEEQILDNSALATKFTFTKDWHGYDMLKIVLYNTSRHDYDTQYIVDEGIDKAFLYSSGRFCVNQIYNNGEATNQYATYSKVDDNDLVWTRVNSRNIHLYAVYGITFIKTTLQKTVLYSKDAAVNNAYVTLTPAEGTTFFDYDAIMYMTCTSDTYITRFSKIWISKPAVNMYPESSAPVFPQRIFEYDTSTRLLNYTPTSLGSQRFFYVVGLKFA